MSSIRPRLFLILTAATRAVWLSAVLWIQNSPRAEVERVLDARLAEAARMVSSLTEIAALPWRARRAPSPRPGAPLPREIRPVALR